MTTRITKRHTWASRALLFGLALALPVAGAQAQGATITGKVTSEFGQANRSGKLFHTTENERLGGNQRARGLHDHPPAARATGTSGQSASSRHRLSAGIRPFD